MATKDTDKQIQETLNRVKPIAAATASALKYSLIFPASVILILLTAFAGTYAFFSASRGKTPSPKADAEIDRIVEIDDITKKISIESNYTRVTLDVPEKMNESHNMATYLTRNLRRDAF